MSWNISGWRVVGYCLMLILVDMFVLLLLDALTGIGDLNPYIQMPLLIIIIIIINLLILQFLKVVGWWKEEDGTDP